MQEIWKDVKGYEGLYQDTASGKIYDTAIEAAKAFNIKQQHLSRQLRGDRKNRTTLKFLSECA